MSPSENWKERGFKKPGRKMTGGIGRAGVAEALGIAQHIVRQVPLTQLLRCKDRAAMRLLLGVSK